MRQRLLLIVRPQGGGLPLRRWGHRNLSTPANGGRRLNTFERAVRRERGYAGKQDRSKSQSDRNTAIALYAVSTVIGCLGLSYAAVPLYQAFCQATGYGGTVRRVTDEEKFRNMKPVAGARPVTVHFTADRGDSMPWTFQPRQKKIRVLPGETALAFYTAKNTTNKPVTGISSYNVTPMRAGVHFNKLQCFCFEEQRLRPNEEIDMPVQILFYIDPEFADDPSMTGVREIVLSYTFFRSGQEEVLEGMDDDAIREAARKGLPARATSVASAQGRVDEWSQQVSERTGIPLQQFQARK